MSTLYSYVSCFFGFLGRLFRNVLFQLLSFVILIGVVSISYGAWTTLNREDATSGKKITSTLMQGIIDNINDLKRTTTISRDEVVATLPKQNIINSCYSTTASVIVPKSGMYAIELQASAYVYSGNYNNLSVFLADKPNPTSYICTGGAGITLSSQHGYIFPQAFCIRHLDASKTYILQTIGSDAMYCHTSSLRELKGANVRLRLLSED